MSYDWKTLLFIFKVQKYFAVTEMNDLLKWECWHVFDFISLFNISCIIFYLLNCIIKHTSHCLFLILQQIRDADERRKKLEQQKMAAATELQAKQEEIKTISNETEKQKTMESIQNLEVKILHFFKLRRFFYIFSVNSHLKAIIKTN